MTKNAVTQQTRPEAYHASPKGVVEASSTKNNVKTAFIALQTACNDNESCLDLEIFELCDSFMKSTYIQKSSDLKISDIEHLADQIDDLIVKYNEGFVVINAFADTHYNPNSGNEFLSQKVKIAVCGLLGALVGLVLGAVVGSLLGGYGAIPGGFLGLVKGFTVGTAIAGGGCVLGAAMGSGLGLFKHKRDVKVSAVSANKAEQPDSAAPKENDSPVSTKVAEAKDKLIAELKNEVNARKQLRNYV